MSLELSIAASVVAVLVALLSVVFRVLHERSLPKDRALFSERDLAQRSKRHSAVH